MIRVGLLGAGFMGATHAAAYAHVAGARLVAVAATSHERAAKLAAGHQAKVYDALEPLIEDPEVDAVDICLPTSVHEAAVIAAAEAGKHILCEKPLTLTLAAADRMVETVRRSGVVAMVGQVVRFWHEYVVIKELLASGQLGHPLSVSAYRLAEFPRWSRWFADPALSGGALLDLQLHDLDYLYSLFGLPAQVYARGTATDGSAWNHVVTMLSYDEMSATVESSYLMPDGFPFTAGLRLVGEAGCVEYRFQVQGQVDQRASAQNELILYCPGRAPQVLASPGPDAYVAEITYFIDCVRQGRPPAVATLAEAREVLRIPMAAKESLETGRVITL